MKITKLFFMTLLVPSIFPVLILLGCAGKLEETIPTQWIPKAVKSIDIGKGTVNALEFSPNGKYLAVAGSEVLYIYDTNTGAPISLAGHEGAVLAVAWADNKTLASGGEDKTVRLWNAKNRKLLKVLEGHKGRVNTLAFSPNGKTLASGSGYKEDYFSKLPDKPVKSPDMPIKLPSNPEELKKYLDEQRKLMDGLEKEYKVRMDNLLRRFTGDPENFDSTIRLWNASTGEHQRTLKSWSTALAFVGNKTLASSEKDGGLQWWDVSTGSRGRKITLSIVEDNRFVTVAAGAVHVEGDRIYRGPLSIINDEIYVGTGGQYTTPDGQVYPGSLRIYPKLTVITLSPNGTRLAMAKARVVDSRGSKTYENINIKVITRPDGLSHYMEVKSLVTAMAFSPKGTLLASGSADKTIRLWNAAIGKPRQTLEGHTAGITALAFSRAGTLASGSNDGKVLLWGAGE